jgi:hypothetical protein
MNKLSRVENTGKALIVYSSEFARKTLEGKPELSIDSHIPFFVIPGLTRNPVFFRMIRNWMPVDDPVFSGDQVRHDI